MVIRNGHSNEPIKHLSELEDEIENFEEIGQHIKPEPGDIPDLKGIDVYGCTIPFAGRIGGDHIIYIDFKQRHDLDIRIARARKDGLDDVASELEKCKHRSGILVADVSGHRITDAMLTAMLHQAFLLGVVYELEANGRVTTKLFENINNRFYRSSSVKKFLTMVYGEIEESGRFSFISAGHPHPAVFSNEYNKLVDIHPEILISFPPIGTMLYRGDPDISRDTALLGYKDRYRLNELTLMSSGDILILYTDGLTDHNKDGDYYFPAHFESRLKAIKTFRAKKIAEEIYADLLNFAEQDDDVTFVIVKKN